MILNLCKKEGETPLQRLERWRLESGASLDEKATYAGRLDPMAEGVLIILTGDDIPKKDQFLRLDKEYEFEVLWGISSDTYDILGEISISGNAPNDEQITEDVSGFKGTVEIPYPPYSSKTVSGKPLWAYAREGKLEELEFPKRSMNIIELQFLGSRNVTGDFLLQSVVERISKIDGDFRQEDILETWREGIGRAKNTEYRISKFKALVSSGTYIRSLAVRMGEKYNTSALAWSITRTKVGSYHIADST